MANEAAPIPRGGETLPRSHRITRRRDYIEIYEGGRRVVSRYVIVFVKPNTLDHPRLGVTTTRRLGKAHDRNRMKRWVREVFRREDVMPGAAIDVVVNPRKGATNIRFEAFLDDLRTTILKAARREERRLDGEPRR